MTHIESTIETSNKKDNGSFINYFKNNKKNILLIIFSSFLFAFATTSLLTKASTVPTGLSAVSMTISLILPIIKPYLNFVYLALNIPLFIIFWNKNKKAYTYSTLTFLISNAIFGFLIGYDFNGGTYEDGGSLDFYISNYVFVFYPPTDSMESSYAQANNIKNMATVAVNDFNTWLLENWYDKPNQTIIDALSTKPTGNTLAIEKGWPVFVYSLSAVVLASFAGAISWKFGGSTGGTDIIAYYYSTKNKKPVGTILLIIGSLIVSISLIVLWLFSNYSPDTIKQNINGFNSLFSLQTLASALYVVLFGVLVNVLYPKYKKVVIKIDTINVDLIKNYLKESKFNHSYKIHTLTSGWTGKEIYTFETIILLLEVEDLIRNIKKIDPTAWISKSTIKKIYGAFDYSKVE